MLDQSILGEAEKVKKLSVGPGAMDRWRQLGHSQRMYTCDLPHVQKLFKASYGSKSNTFRQHCIWGEK